VIPHAGWTLIYVDSEALPSYAATYAFDGNASSFWHTQYYPNSPGYPHEIQINLGDMYTLEGFRYLPRQDGEVNGHIAQYEFYVSEDGTNWGSPVATGAFVNTSVEKSVSFTPKIGQFIRLRALSEVNGNPWSSMAEINVLGTLSGTNHAPDGVIDNPSGDLTINSGQSVSFGGTGSDPDGNLPLTYRWQFGGSGVPDSNLEDPGTLIFNVPGTYTITFTVTDATGLADPTPATRVITVRRNSSPISQLGWSLKYMDSEEISVADNAATNSFDGDVSTFWHTRYYPSSTLYPHEIQINLGQTYYLDGFRYLPRQDGGVNGHIAQYEFYVSIDGNTWGSPVATGVFANSAAEKEVSFTPKTGQFIRLVALSEVNGNPWASMAEINIWGDHCASPGTPSNPSPQNEATGIATGINLSWSPSVNADSYDVYFGMSSPPPKVSNTAGTTHPVYNLSNNTLYYWQIVSRNNCGDTTAGPIWSFTTVDYDQWFSIGPFGGELVGTVQALTIDANNSKTIYARTDVGVFKSINGGTTWAAVNDGLTDTPIQTLASDPRAPDTLYIGNVDGVYKSTDAGASWLAMNNDLTNTDIRAFVINPQAPDIIYAGTLGGGVFKSINGGTTWTAINTGLTSADITLLAIDPQAPQTLYASGGGSVFKSTDGGANWTVTTRVDGEILTINPQVPQILYARNGYGLFKSTDGGATWTEISFHSPYPYISSIAINPQNPDILYSAERIGETRPLGAIYKSIDGGVTWSLTGLRAYPRAGIYAIDPQTPDTLYAGSAAGLFKSTDGGDHWAEVYPIV